MSVISEKQRAAEAATEYVKNGMIVGLGSGSTAEFAVKRLGEMVREGLSIRGIPTSDSTKKLAEIEGIPLINFSETEIKAATQSISYRGPDDTDFFFWTYFV